MVGGGSYSRTSCKLLLGILESMVISRIKSGRWGKGISWKNCIILFLFYDLLTDEFQGYQDFVFIKAE